MRSRFANPLAFFATLGTQSIVRVFWLARAKGTGVYWCISLGKPAQGQPADMGNAHTPRVLGPKPDFNSVGFVLPSLWEMHQPQGCWEVLWVSSCPAATAWVPPRSGAGLGCGERGARAPGRGACQGPTMHQDGCNLFFFWENGFG